MTANDLNEPGHSGKSRDNFPRPIAAIIGAGKTGRGFIARFAAAANYEIVFVDESEGLVNRIKEGRAYTIHFFGEQRKSIRIDGVTAELIGSAEAENVLARATVVFTAVGEQNLTRTAPHLHQALVRRRQLNIDSPYYVITCENGVNPGTVLQEALKEAAAARGAEPAGEAVLREALKEAAPSRRAVPAGEAVLQAQFRISEAIIFCSTIEKPGTRLDIQSESYDELPYDGEPVIGFQKLPGMVEAPDFKQLLKRKIYTYNCISACIAYLGAYKGYELYADAANDSDIGAVLEQIVEPLNKAICARLHVDPVEQRHFAESALNKFRNAHIRDDIARNARNVIRKLSPNDRMVAPALMIRDSGGSLSALALVMAAAMLYRGPEEGLLETMLDTKGVEYTFTSIASLSSQDPLTKLVVHHFECLSKVQDQAQVKFTGMIKKEMA